MSAKRDSPTLRALNDNRLESQPFFTGIEILSSWITIDLHEIIAEPSMFDQLPIEPVRQGANYQVHGLNSFLMPQ